MERNYFHAVDYVVFLLMFVVSMGIGLYFALAGSKQNTTGEYLMGGRNMQLLPVAASLGVSVISANTLLGAPAETYTYGVMYYFMLIGLTMATIVCAALFVPLLYPLKITSANEYLEKRFRSRAVRLLATCIVLLNQGLYVGTVIFGPATALETATGCPPWASILIVSIIGTAYTAVGGMKAVVWTDFFQSFIMVAGMVAIIISGASKVGGLGEVWDINMDWGRLFIDWSIHPLRRFTIWNSVLGYTCFWVGFYGINQPCVQRYCGLPTMTKGKIAMLLNGPIFGTFQTLAVIAGLTAFAYYAQRGCDPLRAKYISNANQIIPYFVMEVLNYPGLPGIFISSLFSGALSTLSSSINSMAAVVWEDMLQNRYSHLPESRQAFITKCLVVVFGLACMSIAYMALYVGGNLVQLSGSFIGASIGPLAGLFFLGATFPHANWLGAFSGTVISLAFVCWMMFGQTFLRLGRNRLPSDISKCGITEFNMTSYTTASPSFIQTTSMSSVSFTDDIYMDDTESLSGLKWFYSISFTWYALIAIVITLIIGILVSLLTGGENTEKVDDELLFNFVRHCRRSKTDGGHVKEQQITFLRMEPSPMVKPKMKDTNSRQSQRPLLNRDSSIRDPRENIDVTDV